jgi:hypothetical protein
MPFSLYHKSSVTREVLRKKLLSKEKHTLCELASRPPGGPGPIMHGILDVHESKKQ